MKISLFSFALITYFLSGCAYPKRTTPFSSAAKVPGKAAVYVYRTMTSTDSLNPEIPRFFINGKLIGKLSLGGYYVEYADPGDVEIFSKGSFMGIPTSWKEKSIRFLAEPNKTYFVKFSIETVARLEDLRLVPTEQGEREIATTVLLTN